MTRLTIEGVSVVRAGRAILDGADLAFEGGGLVGVIGPNGAGKSTLLSVMAGLLRPEKGQARLDGQDLARIPPRELARRRAYLPQNPRAEWPIPVERLVALGLTPELPAIGGLPAAFTERIDRALAACDLDGQRGQAATTLSGGELARAMLARALVGDPEILIVDEPLSGLDPRHALDSAERLKARAAAGALVVASMHDLTLAARYATRIVALRDGAVVADGPTAEVLTGELLRRLFDVDASVSGEGGAVRVDFSAPA